MQRRLAAILSADVVGYSGLMETDEAGTLERLKTNRRELFDPCVIKYGGRIVKLMGDGALIEFGSVVAAVECAVALQSEMAGTAEETIRYRIGVNLGDVIVDGNDIYGDGVNVAARLQALAPEGGVAISRAVRDHIEGKLHVGFRDQGEHAVKNIQRPVHVFILEAPQSTVKLAKQSERGSASVSICVLPFVNMSGDLEQEYFSDGISEDIITDLSKVSALWVAARHTAFAFKGRQIDVSQVARQLKVTHILEGSVRKSGKRVRITAQLIDASGGHIWAERYDRDLNDIFALQDEISKAVVSALKLRLLPDESKEIGRRGTNNLQAYQLYLIARQYNLAGGSAHRQESIIRLCQRAVELDANYARAWALMANAQVHLRFQGGKGDGGFSAAQRAIELDAALGDPHAVLARVHLENLRRDEVLKEIETALMLDPESHEVNRLAGTCYYGLHRFAEAIVHWEKAASMADTDYNSVGMLVSCYAAVGDHDGVRRAAERTLERTEKLVAAEPDNGSAIAHLVNALAVLNEPERAKAWAERAMLLDPENFDMHYNIACAFITSLHDHEAALDLLRPGFERGVAEAINWMKFDPDLDAIRDHPRFVTMMAEAEAKLARGKSDA